MDSAAITHVIVIMDNGSYHCTCPMGTNLGVPCRHFFATMLHSPHVTFHISMIRARSVFSFFISLTETDPLIDGIKILLLTRTQSRLSREPKNTSKELFLVASTRFSSLGPNLPYHRLLLQTIKRSVCTKCTQMPKES